MSSPETGGTGEGGLSYETDGDARRLAWGCKFWILVSLKVFWAKRQYFMYACIGYDDHVFIPLQPAHCMSYLCVFKRSPLGAKFCLNHAQIGLL